MPTTKQKVSEPSRSLDAQVALFMGWKFSAYVSEDSKYRWLMRPPDGREGLVLEPPKYSTEIKHGWTVFEKMRDSGLYCCLTIKSDYNYVYDVTWVHESDLEHEYHSIGFSVESAAHAICLAALAATSGASAPKEVKDGT